MTDLLSNGRLAETVTEIVTSVTPVTFTDVTGPYVRFTGTTDQKVILADATTCFEGQRFVIMNRSIGQISVYLNDGTTFQGKIAAGKEAEFRILTNGAANGTWDQFKTGDASISEPLLLYAESVPTAVLNIGPSLVSADDGAGKTTSAINDVVISTTLIQINFQSSVISGGTVTAALTSNSLQFPYTTLGQFRRLVFAAQATGSIATSFSSAAASVPALTNAGTLLSPLSGQALGYMDLEATAPATTFNFATTDVNIGTEFITVTGHGFSNGRTISFTTSGTLPGGLVTATTYYVVNSTLNTFQVSLTSGGTFIDLTSVGTGTHTVAVHSLKTAGSATSVIESDVGGVASIIRFGSGGGGGGVALKDGGIETSVDTTDITYSVVSGKVNFHPFMNVVTGHTLTILSGARLVSTGDTINGTVVVDPGGIWKVL